MEDSASGIHCPISDQRACLRPRTNIAFESLGMAHSYSSRQSTYVEDVKHLFVNNFGEFRGGNLKSITVHKQT
jgi:hypothetical protein